MTQTVEPAAPLRPVSSDQDVWTIQRILLWSTDFLKDRHITDSPRLDAEILLAHALKLKRIQLYTLFDKPVSALEREPFKAALKRRIAGEPVAYITGERDFMSMTFNVSPEVLIPRPDTEILVEAATEKLKPRQTEELQILDIGTGSGCIAISVAKKFPVATMTAWDVSEPALAVARENAARLEASNVTFACRDALSPESWDGAAYDVILANPPYIAMAEAPALASSVRDHEPSLALFAADDGLAFYQMFARHAKDALKPGGFLAMEIGYQQAYAVCGLLAAHGWQNIEVRKDYGKNDRVVIAEP
jgi:release factor glutamine methyltransferase